MSCNRNTTLVAARRNWLRLAASCASIALSLSAPAFAADAAGSTTTAADDTSGVITVTAQRREQSINEVPISINSYDKKLMDQEGIRTIADLARYTPSLTFTSTSGVSGNNGSNIAIRGLSSDVGGATTAIYIDDTPIQMRNVGYYGGNAYPRVFDLQRVEVLYGPQGTLFGASAEGGAVRFITPGPNYDGLHEYGRGQVSFTDGGAPSYETGLAVGAPITENLAFRVSGWYQHTGGYIDQVTPGTDDVIKKNINSGDSQVYHATLGWKPTDTLTLTPSFYYQRTHSNARDDYWEGYSDPGNGQYRTGVAGAEPSTDTFYLPSLKAEWKVAPNINLIANSSYFDRTQRQTLNYATYLSVINTGDPFGTYANKDTSNANDYLTMKQQNLTEEARLQSYGNRLIDWTAGVYYSHSKQDFSNYTGSAETPGVLIGGLPQYDGQFSYVNFVHAKDSQIAGYASVDVKPTTALTLTAAIRYSHVDYDFTNVTAGPEAGGVVSTHSETMTQGAWTPKFGVSYKIAPNNMVYASVAKGFRPGGAEAAINATSCASDLASLGLKSSPTAYQSDSLWSYEAGTKNSLDGGKVNLGASAYVMKWKNIQQSVRLPTCGFSYIDNLGDATSKGLEATLELRPVQGFSIGGNIGYVDMTYDSNVYGGAGLLLKEAGQHIGGPSWTGHLFSSVEQPVSTEVKGYLRGDYTFTSSQYQQAPEGTYGYDSGLYALGASHFASLRMGARWSGMDLSLFIDNVFNSHDVLSRNHDSTGSSLYYDQTFRPRTIGLTLSFMH